MLPCEWLSILHTPPSHSLADVAWPSQHSSPPSRLLSHKPSQSITLGSHQSLSRADVVMQPISYPYTGRIIKRPGFWIRCCLWLTGLSGAWARLFPFVDMLFHLLNEVAWQVINWFPTSQQGWISGVTIWVSRAGRVQKKKESPWVSGPGEGS